MTTPLYSQSSMSTPDIVLAPRTPTPPISPTPFAQTPTTPRFPTQSPQHKHAHSFSSASTASYTSNHGLGLHAHTQSPLRHSTSQPSITFTDHNHPRYNYDSASLSPVRPYSPIDRHVRKESNASTVLDGLEDVPTPTAAYYTPALYQSDNASPFNFQTTSMSKSPVIKSNISARRGHKYKHSSVSLPPAYALATPTRPPLTLPNSLPIPTFKEFYHSLTTPQLLRLVWSFLHMFIAGYTSWNAHSSSSLEALSHLIFYDSLGALLCVLVEVCSNFEVWGRSSIKHPFGLQRIEVVAGFALSVLLIFFGFDLISHNAKHALEGLGSHVPHRAHVHEESLASVAGSVDLTILLAVAATLISAVLLQNHARIGRAMRLGSLTKLPFPLDSVLSNPSHFLTLSCSGTILVLPLLDLHTYEAIDKIVSLTVATSMLALGVRLGTNVGGMLLMSYPDAGVERVISDVSADPLVRKVEVAKFWQAHYGVGMANLRLRIGDIHGDEGTLIKLRERVVSIIRNRLSGGYGGGNKGQKWEVSVELEQEKADDGFAYSHASGHLGHVQHHHLYA